MDITSHHNSDTATKPLNLGHFEDSDKENFKPHRAPQQLLSNHPTRCKIHSSRRATLKRPKPRGFEPWGPHADFLSPPPRPRISKPLPRRTVANLTSTPPRPSYAERVKGIFASPPPVRHFVEMSRDDLPRDPESTGAGPHEMSAKAPGDGMKMHLPFQDDRVSMVPADEGNSEYQSKMAWAKEKDENKSSPLTTESELERRLDNFALVSPTKKQGPASRGRHNNALEQAPTTFVPSTAPKTSPSSTQQQDYVYRPRRLQHTIPHINIQPTFIQASPMTREEDESSDAWTDDSQFLPSRAERRERKRQRQHGQQAEKINRDRFLHHPDVPRSDMLSPKGMKIAQRAGLMYAKHPLNPGNRAVQGPVDDNNGEPRARDTLLKFPSKPSRFTATAPRRNTTDAQVANIQPTEQRSRLSEDSLPMNYRSSDADDEDSDPDA